MKLNKWAKTQGISYSTAYRWIKTNQMPCEWYQTDTGTIIVQEAAPVGAAGTLPTYIYGRVSSSKQRNDLHRQVERIAAFCAANGWAVSNQFKEIASGMNDNRKELNKLFDLPPGRLVVEHKDRLTRFGFAYIENLLVKLGWEIVIINETQNDEEEIMKDLISIITSFCCRIYGLRRGNAKAQKVKEIIND